MIRGVDDHREHFVQVKIWDDDLGEQIDVSRDQNRRMLLALLGHGKFRNVSSLLRVDLSGHPCVERSSWNTSLSMTGTQSGQSWGAM